MKEIIIKSVQDDFVLASFNAIGKHMDVLPKRVIKRFRENVKKYAGRADKNYNDYWEGIEKYKFYN